MRVAAVLATLAFLAATAVAAGSAGVATQPRSHRVTVRATLQERATYTLTGDAACFWSARGVAVRHLDIATAAPAAVTTEQLARGVGVPLEVHEIRLANHNNVIGACTHLGPEISDPGDRCGKRAYRIPASDVKLHLVGNRLAFSFVRIAADPYGNRCAPSVWGAVPQSGFADLVATLKFPSRAVAAPLSERKHGAGRESDAAWSGTFSTANSMLGRTDVSSSSWQVALTFG
jgi:hypothetical protein